LKPQIFQTFRDWGLQTQEKISKIVSKSQENPLFGWTDTPGFLTHEKKCDCGIKHLH
jgi:hypothetical protein